MRIIPKLILATVCVAPMSVAHAERLHVSAGLGVGVANLDFDAPFAASDTALSVFAAYDFNRYFALEASYVDGGSPSERNLTIDVRHAALMAGGSLPIGPMWSISVRAGMIGWRWETAGVIRDGSDVGYGVGTALELRRMQIRLIADTAEIDDARIVHVSLQGAWRF